jgi:hypothetical protein
MNENIDLTKILKDCPEGTKLWHTVYGEVRFNNISSYVREPYRVFFTRGNDRIDSVTTDGRMYEEYDGECVLFPSKEQRDWSKFVPTWETKKEVVKVTLHPFDKVLVRTSKDLSWAANLITDFDNTDKDLTYLCLNKWYKCCIPYNKDTAHLLGTSDEPEIEYEIEFSKEFKEK